MNTLVKVALAVGAFFLVRQLVGYAAGPVASVVSATTPKAPAAAGINLRGKGYAGFIPFDSLSTLLSSLAPGQTRETSAGTATVQGQALTGFIPSEAEAEEWPTVAV